MEIFSQNLNRNYADRINYNIIVTLNKLGFQNNTYFIPVVLLPFVRFDNNFIYFAKNIINEV